MKPKKAQKNYPCQLEAVEFSRWPPGSHICRLIGPKFRDMVEGTNIHAYRNKEHSTPNNDKTWQLRHFLRTLTSVTLNSRSNQKHV
jgi:hypothetical protein